MCLAELFGPSVSMKDLGQSFKVGGLHAEVEITEHAGTLLVAGKLMNKQGQEVGHHSRHYYLKQEQGKTVLHADGNLTSTDIDEGFNNKGLGKQLVLSTFRFNFNSPNITHFTFDAAEVGRYAWRNCTLPFTSDSLTQIQQSLRKYGVPEKAIAKIRTPRDASRLTTLLPSPSRFITIFEELPGAPLLRKLALARKPGIAALLSVPDAWGVEWDDAYRKSHPNEKFFEE